MSISFIILLAVIIFIVYEVIVSSFSVAPYVPMEKSDLDNINKLADLKSGDKFYELGSGDSRVSFFIAQRNPKAFIRAIEIVTLLFLISKIKTFSLYGKNFKVARKDIFKADISDADVIYIYAMVPTISSRVKNKLEKELKKGSKVISYAFPIKGWEDRLVKKIPKDKGMPIYLYKA